MQFQVWAICYCTLTTGFLDTCSKYVAAVSAINVNLAKDVTTSVDDTGGEFSASHNDIGGQFAAGVVDTGAT